MKYNFHTHSHFDDGRLALEDFVKEAIRLNMDALGFSGHSPMPLDNEWSIRAERLGEYVAEAKKLRHHYRDQIKLYLGLEIDYIPGVSDDFEAFRRDIPLDYCIGSVHLVKNPENGRIWFIDGPAEGYFRGIDEVFGGDVRAAVTAYFRQSTEMVLSQRPDIIGHLDKVKMHNKETLFQTSDSWYRALCEELLEATARQGCIVELNTRGVYTGKTAEFFPADFILESCLRRGIPVMVNSDAHAPEQLLAMEEEAIERLRRIGFRQIQTPFAIADI